MKGSLLFITLMAAVCLIGAAVVFESACPYGGSTAKDITAGRRPFKVGDPSNNIHLILPDSRFAAGRDVMEDRIKGENALAGFRWTLFRILMWLVLFAVPANLIFLTFRVMRMESRTVHTPVEILKTRYAWGGISSEEYARMKRELEI